MQQQGMVLLVSLSMLGFGQAEIGEDADSTSLWSGQNFSLGEIFFPHFHALGVVGDASMDPSLLSVGERDPSHNVDLLTLQPGLSLRLGDHIEALVTSSYITDESGDFTGGIEEAFIKLTNLPAGFELRGGRFLNRIGFQNARLAHTWAYVDQYLVNSRFLDGGGLASIGGEITWNLPTRYPATFSLGIGAPPSIQTDKPNFLTFFEEGNRFDDYIISANLLATWQHNDFHQFVGTLNFAIGENGFGRDTEVIGLGLEYLWSENGLSSGGRSFRWRTEVMYRHFEMTGFPLQVPPNVPPRFSDKVVSADEFGFYSSATYHLDDHWEASLRAEYVEGPFQSNQRWRISPALTWSLDGDRSLMMRLQYNYEQISQYGHEHGIWLGLGINWGGSEVR